MSYGATALASLVLGGGLGLAANYALNRWPLSFGRKDR